MHNARDARRRFLCGTTALVGGVLAILFQISPAAAQASLWRGGTSDYFAAVNWFNVVVPDQPTLMAEFGTGASGQWAVIASPLSIDRMTFLPAPAKSYCDGPL
jgi:hypothetical protein